MDAQYNDSVPCEEAFARVVWSAHILSFLSRSRSQRALLSSTPLGEHDEIEDDDDLESNVGGRCAPVDEHIRIKFLNSLAETLSHTRGWHHVSVTALREYENYVEVDVARNTGFDAHDKDQLYFASFEAFMASQVEGSKITFWINEQEI